MSKNTHSYWSWQGNKLDWSGWYIVGAIAIVLVVWLLLWIFRFRLRRHWEKKTKFLWVFKKEKHMWMFWGSLLFIMQVVRMIVMHDYVNQWEIWVPLHFCRMHIWALSILLMIGQYKKTKFIAIFAIIGFAFGFAFGNLSIPQHQIDPALQTTKAFDGTWDVKPSNEIEGLMRQYGFHFYNSSIDTFTGEDFFIAHMAIATVPMFIWVSNGLKLKLKDFMIDQGIYILLVAGIWSFDWISEAFTSPRWKANAWFIGPNSNNDMKDALGWLSEWPQNLITYGVILGIPVSLSIYLFTMLCSNIQWFENNKVVQFKRSEEWIDFKNDFRRIILRKK